MRKRLALVVVLSQRVAALEAENEASRAQVAALRAETEKNSGNSSMPPSRDPAAERQRQAEERQANKQRAAGAGAAGRVASPARRARRCR